jgi:hypothetical protein
MNHANRLKYDVMLRVRTVRGFRVLVSSPLATGFCAAALIIYSSMIVSLGDVMTNTMAHAFWPERLAYACSALFHSGITVQTLALLIIFACMMVLINSLRKLRVPLYNISQSLASFSVLKFFKS